MKIIRWLLSHTFLILLIVAVIYGYMFWGNLAGENTPAGKTIAYLSSEFVEVAEFVDAIKAKQTQLSQDEAAAPPSAETDEQKSAATDYTETEKPVEVAVAEPVENNAEKVNSHIEQQPVSISDSHNQMQVQQNSATAMETEIQQAEIQQAEIKAEPEIAMPEKDDSTADRSATDLFAANNAAEVENKSDTKEIFVSAEVEKQLDNVDDQGKAKDGSQQSKTVRENWITARKSFYQRNYELSEQSYQSVLDSTEDNFDAYGELGNVFFNQGKNEQAASAYYEAAAILVRKGQVNRARSLMGLLRHLDRSKADELQKLIDSLLS